jgi:hypothetical protein
MKMTCRKCGFPSKPEDEIVIYGVLQHRDCFGAMIDLVSAAQAEAALRATERDRAIDRALSVEMQLEAAKTELKSTHDFYDLAIGVAQAHEARIDELKAELAALKAAGEWRPRVPGPIFNADSAPHGVKSILYLSVDATRDLDSGLWDWDDNGDWYVHGYQPLPTPPADDSERYNPREPGQ